MTEERRIRVGGDNHDTVVLDFEEGPYAGARVVCARAVSMRTFFEFAHIEDITDSHAMDLLKRFGDAVLIDWNVDGRNGAPLPADGEGLLDGPLDLALEILRRWMEVLAVPGLPLAEKSLNTKRAASIPMVVLSESQSN